VENHGRAELEQFRIALESLARRAQAAMLAVPDGDHIPGAEEDHHLAGLDDFGSAVRLRVVVVNRLDDGEEHVLVLLELWALVSLDGVLDSEWV
jgi:hypothetical protein